MPYDPQRLSRNRRVALDVGDCRHRFAELLVGGDFAATSEACNTRAMAQAVGPPSTNRTEPTAIQAAASGSWVSWYISQPMMTVEGMVMTQAATISITTRRLTPWARGDTGADD
jgi:hypothetical protein